MIGEQKANISDLVFRDRKPDFYRISIDLELRDAEHLHTVVSALEAEADVAAVERHRKGVTAPAAPVGGTATQGEAVGL